VRFRADFAFVSTNPGTWAADNKQCMRYLALATDYDGTLAKDGAVDSATLEALNCFRQSGRKLILVTGRELPELKQVFPHLDVFDRVVAENGAVLYNPSTKQKRVLAQAPPDRFMEELRKRKVRDVRQGDVIVATWRPCETTVLKAIRDLGLELQVIFNKDAVMVLPAGVNKATGLDRALSELKISRHNIAGIGDAENDHAFLNCCECAVAVANAIPALKEHADLVTKGDRGAGVAELISRILGDDLRSLPLSLEKHGVLLGQADSRDIYIDAEGRTVLLCGQSGGGKSTFVSGLVERLMAREYQTCIVDPEGDYENMEGLVTIGNKENPPSCEQVFQLLADPKASLVINLTGVKMQDRPGFFATLLTRLQEMKLREARPHWIVVDEAHHLLPPGWTPASAEVASQMSSLLLVAVHPKHVSPAALRLVSVLAVIGKEPNRSAQEFAEATGIALPPISADDLNAGEACVWLRESNQVIARMRWIPGRRSAEGHE
jgi:phosphoglycolate phosphatase (TIGR01487 family)